MHAQATIETAHANNRRRTEIISINRSRRMRGMEPLPVPAKITLTGFEVYVDGDYEFFLTTDNADEAMTEALEYQRIGQLEPGKVTLKKAPINGF